MALTLTRDQRLAARAVRLAKERPQLVKLAIAQLRERGDIETGDLLYLERIAERWLRTERQQTALQALWPTSPAVLRAVAVAPRT